ncbi:hypothetical protein BsWGS_20885 [Bradybaena similaris]
MPSVLAWGKASLGALGLAGSEHTSVATPHQIQSLEGVEIQHISSGEAHTLICLKDGSVHTCGSSDFQQCGRSGILTKFGRVVGLDSQHVTHVCAGASHSIALTQAHEVFTWGKNDCGQLGRGDVPLENQGIPKLVKSLAVRCVLQVSCGSDHAVALTNEGLVFAWGSNSYGQLGLGRNAPSHQNLPELISCLKGIPIQQVTAGGNHTFVLSKSGAVYGWGRNSFGQLGLNDTKEYYQPQQCRPLRSQRIKYICCGDNHTACLTKDGRVFTFGAGSYGQLGHNSNNNEILPKQVIELSGSEVTQIACGRGHTLAYVPKYGKVYAFGLGGSGQLGLSSTENKNSPFAVPGPFAAGSSPLSTHSSMQIDSQGPELRVRFIHAGGDHSFVIADDADRCVSDDFRIEDSTRQILTLSQHMIEKLRPLGATDTPSHELSEELDKVFSNASCLNGSFLLANDEHYGSSSRIHGVDMNAVRTFFQDLATISNIVAVQYISTDLEQHLIPMLPVSPPDVEALRLYLMLPECHLFDQPKLYNSIICPFAKNFLSLDKVAQKVFDYWWPSNQPSFFNRLVVIYKQCIEYLLQLPDTTNPLEVNKRHAGLFTSMEMLQKLNQVNEANNQIIPYHKFYVPELKDKVNIRADYISWVQRTHNRSQVGKVAVQVVFQGEEAVDEGGVRKEFFMLLLREVMDQKYGMFRTHDISNLQWFNPSTFEEPEMFKMIGTLCGLAIYNFTIIDLHFPLALYKKLLKRNVSLDDVKELMPDVGRGLQDLIDFDGDEFTDVFILTFEVIQEQYGETKSVELCPDGANRAVKQDNKLEYINLYVDYLLNKSVKTQFDAFSEGFHNVCGGVVLDLFHPQELQAMVVGNEDYDFLELEKNTDYKGEYHRYHPTISLFWEVFHQMSLEDKKKFLLFLTGSDRIPVFGMKYVKMIIQPTGGGEDFLPVAHTCFNVLDLPKYTTKERLKAKLLLAIQQTEGFGLV